MSHLLQQLLIDSAEREPDTEAVCCREESRTYRELHGDSSNLARLLVELGLARGDRVGICLPKSIEAVVSIFGALKAGAVYVPLDFSSPPRRLAWMIQDCRIQALVTTFGQAQRILDELDQPPFPGVILAVPDGDGDGAPESRSLPIRCLAWSQLDQASARTYRPPHQTEEDLAYILYTSGSTGSPKGVMISHRAALTFVDWAVREIRLTGRDRVSNHAPFQFDLSVFDLFATVSAGATMVLVPEELSAFPRDLSYFWEREEITVWYSVPSVLSRLVSHGNLQSRDLSSLRAVLFAGEVFPVDHFRQFARLVPQADLYNLYGPTETNVCTYYRIEDPSLIDTAIPIGRPCPNVDAWAVKENGEPAGPGESGELWVAGPLLMKGYWGQPEKTQLAFAHVPAPGGWGRVRAYRTGDMVDVEADGEFRFRGRRDSMVKLRGYRVEPGEVEASLYQHPAVLEAAVFAIAEGTSEAALAAALVPRDDSELETEALLEWLRERLPAYMIPAHFKLFPRLPRTATGKVDTRLLKKQLRDREA